MTIDFFNFIVYNKTVIKRRKEERKMKVVESKVKIYFNEQEKNVFKDAADFLQEFLNFLSERGEVNLEINEVNFYYADFENFVETLKDLGMGEPICIE